VSITIDLAPHLFNTRAVSFENPPRGDVPESETSLMEKVKEAYRPSEDQKEIQDFFPLLSDIDKKVDDLQETRIALLYFRNLAMKRIAEEMTKADKTTDETRVLHYVLDEHSENIEKMSKALNLREARIRNVLEGLKREFSSL
jgi:predicted transcriptional regulator